MKGAILDKGTFERGDINFSNFLAIPIAWIDYTSTSPAQVRERITGCNIIITNKVVLSKEVLESTNCLQLVLIAATGTDNVDLEVCRERGVTVCNVRHYATPAVAQHVFTLMLNLLTNQIQYHGDVRAGVWSKSDVFCLLNHPIVELQNKTLGVIGYGVLGKKVCEIAKAFGMSVQICQRPGGSEKSGRITFDQILTDSDVLTLHCPLTADTNRVFGEKEFSRMKSSAIIINTARGAIIDSEALVSALNQGQIAGAGIDVLNQEPPPVDHPLLQEGVPNLIVTPHNAWGSKETRQRLVDQLAGNMGAWIGGIPINVVS